MTLSNYDLPKELLKGIEEFSRFQLKRKDDLHKLLVEAARLDNQKFIEELSFTAKYVQGLMRVLKAGTNNPEVSNLEHIKSDFSNNMQKLSNQLKDFLSKCDDEVSLYFSKTYLEMTQPCLHNLSELLSDLEWTKKYLNFQKRSEYS